MDPIDENFDPWAEENEEERKEDNGEEQGEE